MLMYVILVVLFLMICFILYFKWIYHPPKPLPPCSSPEDAEGGQQLVLIGSRRSEAAHVVL